ncbi:MAG: recombinase family protein [Anaerolineae bacterium]
MPATFLSGPAGTGKTTRAVEHLRRLLREGASPQSILVLVPQLTLAQPYRAALRDAALPGAAAVDVLTLNGLARTTIDLFWPLGAATSGFGRPHHRPVFLTIATAQYYLRQAIDPLLQEGYFDPGVVPVTISLPRLMSQILDNLNKAALIGLPHTQVSGLLSASLTLEPNSRVALEHTQACVNRFREFCLARNLLDFSLRIETFARHLWPVPGVRQFLTGRYRHLIVDNVEEDTPFAHNILRDWLPRAESALLLFDDDAGYRIFLGANWRTARQLAELCDPTDRAADSRVAPPEMLALGDAAADILHYHEASTKLSGLPPVNHSPSTIHHSQFSVDPRPAFTFEQTRFYPQMLNWVIERIAALVKEGVPPDEIVVLAPFVSDALRFAFTHQMEQRGLTVRSHRPSRPLSEEPAAKTALTLARLAFPRWNLLPEVFDVAQALSQAIAGLDLVRASLLAQVVYRPQSQTPGGSETLPVLSPFEQLEGPARERITYELGNRYDELRRWLLAVSADDPPPLDHFISRLFGEVLSQPNFGFAGDREAGQIIANLIDSARQFRAVVAEVPRDAAGNTLPTTDQINRDYLQTIEDGIAAAQYVRGWELTSTGEDSGAVLLTPATTFLMSNRPVRVQFWLDAGSSGWWERIAQPLTHPYILAADWPPGRLWTDADEVAAQHDRLSRLLLGLTRRCREHVYIVNAEIGEQGYEQRGQLLSVLQRLLRRLQKTDAGDAVDEDHE